MDKFWDNRFQNNLQAYGKAPNEYIKTFIEQHDPGKILFPGEGQGRNAIYAAMHNWEVDAFDYSSVAREQTLNIADQFDIKINYWVETFQDYLPKSGYYDAVALCYVHLPAKDRTSFYHKLWQCLKPGGLLVMEAFTKTQLAYQSGGPKAIELLFDQKTVVDDFQAFEIVEILEMETVLDEGTFHQGPAHIIRYLGKKSNTESGS